MTERQNSSHGLAQETKDKPESPLILIVSQKFDPHVDIIISKLNEKHTPFVRFNTEDFPLRTTLTVLFEGIIHSQNLAFPINHQLKGSDITAVWYRRPAPFKFPSEFSPAAHVFADQETRATIAGLWQLLDCIWVNHPENNRIAEFKLNQLKIASKLGFEIPRTIITNDPEEARKFFQSCPDNIIVKSIGGGLVENDPDMGAIFTNKVNKKDMRIIDSLRYTPTFFQEYIPKEVELRITVVGKRVFAAEIHSQTQEATRHDWRRDTLSLPHKEHHLPRDIEEKCKALVNFFGLNFGAIDMILTPNGRYVFLEINPNGQWAWVEELTGMPISDALVDLLSRNQS